MKKIIILIAVAFVLGGYWWMNGGGWAPAGETANKLDMQAVCESALVYMSFPDGETAERFVLDCLDGKYPEVIERYKADMGLGAEAEV